MEGTLKDYQKVYQMLEDDESRDIYLNRLNWEISGDPKYLAAIITNYVHTDSFLFLGGEPIENFRNALPKDKKLFCMGRENWRKIRFHFGEMTIVSRVSAVKRRRNRKADIWVIP